MFAPPWSPSARPWKLFALSDSVPIAVADTTTTTVTALLGAAALYLFAPQV